MRGTFVMFDRMAYLDFVRPHDALTRLRTMNILPNFE